MGHISRAYTIFNWFLKYTEITDQLTHAYKLEASRCVCFVLYIEF